jgi:hypothetical protein
MYHLNQGTFSAELFHVLSKTSVNSVPLINISVMYWAVVGTLPNILKVHATTSINIAQIILSISG